MRTVCEQVGTVCTQLRTINSHEAMTTLMLNLTHIRYQYKISLQPWALIMMTKLTKCMLKCILCTYKQKLQEYPLPRVNQLVCTSLTALKPLLRKKQQHEMYTCKNKFCSMLFPFYFSKTTVMAQIKTKQTAKGNIFFFTIIIDFTNKHNSIHKTENKDVCQNVISFFLQINFCIYIKP